MAEGAERQESFLKETAALLASIQKAALRDGTLAAMSREGIKDVRSTIHEVFFGQPERGGEPGAPLNPTQGEIAAGRGEDGHASGPSDGGVHGKDERPGGQTLEHKSWLEWLEGQRQKAAEGGNEQNERAKGRSLPEEEQDKAKEQERDRGGRCR